jgi:hypothetical protein
MVEWFERHIEGPEGDTTEKVEVRA